MRPKDPSTSQLSSSHPLRSNSTSAQPDGTPGHAYNAVAGGTVVAQPRVAPKPPIADLLADEPTDGGISSTITSSVNGPLPARPLPPATLHLHSLVHSHLSSRLPPLLEHLRTQTSQLQSVQADLASGEPAVRDEMARLEAVRAVCVGVADKVGTVLTAGEDRVRDLERRGEVAVDEIVCSVSIVHNQQVRSLRSKPYHSADDYLFCVD
jgi:ESCRT-I complex subunit TSG101